MKKLHIPQSHTGGRVACRYGSRPSRSATVRPVTEEFFLAADKSRRCADCEAILERRALHAGHPCQQQAAIALHESIRAGIKAAIQILPGAGKSAKT
jgi:hypothetical protein